METKVWVVDKDVEKQNTYPQLTEAVNLLRQGEVIAFPTETVYGLGADATNEQAVQKIFEAKGRPNDNPLIVHIADARQLKPIVSSISPLANILIHQFWPGPLTIIFPSCNGVSKRVTAGLDTVAVRMPDHPVARMFLKMANIPVAAPSANISGRPSPTLASHVYVDLNGKIAGIVDGGATGVGVESTVLDITGAIPTILRPGGVTKEQLEAVIGPVMLDKGLQDESQKPKAPGMKYKHYAPKASLTIVEGSREFLQELVTKQQDLGKRVGVLTTEENASFYDASQVLACGKRAELTTVAAKLYDSLRQFDEGEVDVIFSESFPNEGIGIAIMNRLIKAAGHHIIVE